MKGCIFFLLVFLPATITYAQKIKQLPDFGKVTKEELELKDCSFDKNSGAMIIFDDAESYFSINLASISPVFQQTEHHVRMKIFNKSGFDRANIRIRYPSATSDVSVKRLTAQTYNLGADGNIIVSKVDKGSVYDKKINKHYSEKIFAFPDVKEGSVLEYSYILEGMSEGKWYFQKSIPVQFSRFVVKFPDQLIVSVVPYVNLPMSRGKELRSDGEYSWYAMENIPGLKDEPFMSCREDYLQNLELRPVAIDFPGTPRINLMKTWPGIIKNLIEDEDFGKQLKRNIPRTSELDALLQTVNDEYTKMFIIHKYVRNNMEWNNYDNIWAMDGVRSAWKDKKGTSGEINLILINLLRDAGLKASPVLVSTRENGIINTGVPGYDQFNKVLAYVQVKNKIYILDATEKITPSHLIPLEVMASEGLVIEKPDTYEWGWKILWDESHQKKNTVVINAEIDGGGIMKGEAIVNSYEYEKIKQLQLLKGSTDKLKESLAGKQDIKIDSLSVADADNDTLPLLQTFTFTAPTSSSGEYHYFSTNYFAGLNENPFIEDTRQTDVFFGVKQNYNITANIFLPDGYQMEGLPKNIKLITSDTGIIFKRQSSFADGLLYTNISLQFRDPQYTPDSYPELREFYKKLLDLLNEKFVYRKK